MTGFRQQSLSEGILNGSRVSNRRVAIQRAQIVRTYGLAMSLVLTFQTNAGLFDNFEEASHIAFRSKLDADIRLARIKEQGLINYGDNLRKMYSMAKSEVLALLAVLPSE